MPGNPRNWGRHAGHATASRAPGGPALPPLRCAAAGLRDARGAGGGTCAIMPPKARSLKLRKGMLTMSSCRTAEMKKITTDAHCTPPPHIT